MQEVIERNLSNPRVLSVSLHGEEQDTRQHAQEVVAQLLEFGGEVVISPTEGIGREAV